MAHRPRITSTAYPFLSIRIDLRGHHHDASALLDTGFTGDLVVPTSLLTSSLGLPDARVDWELADGSIVGAPVYFGIIEIVGLARVPATVAALGNEYILGRGVIDRFRVTFDHGRQVIVEP